MADEVERFPVRTGHDIPAVVSDVPLRVSGSDDTKYNPDLLGVEPAAPAAIDVDDVEATAWAMVISDDDIARSIQASTDARIVGAMPSWPTPPADMRPASPVAVDAAEPALVVTADVSDMDHVATAERIDPELISPSLGYIARRDTRYPVVELPTVDDIAQTAGDTARERVIRALPDILSGTDAAKVIVSMVDLKASTGARKDAERVLESTSGIVEALFGDKMPNRVNAGRAARLGDLNEVVVSEAISATIATDDIGSQGVIASRALGVLGVQVHHFSLDGRYYADGEEVARAITVSEGNGKPVLARQDYPIEVRRYPQITPDVTDTIAGQVNLRGESYKTVLVVQNPDDDGAGYVVAVEPRLTHVAGLDARIISEVGAVPVRNNAFKAVLAEVLGGSTDRIMTGVGTSTSDVAIHTRRVDLPAANEWLSDPMAVGVTAAEVKVIRANKGQKKVVIELEQSPVPSPWAPPSPDSTPINFK